MVVRARARAVRSTAGINLAVARSQTLPYADHSFDVVTCITVLTFIPDAGVAIREMARVLRPGGRLVIGDLHAEGIEHHVSDETLAAFRHAIAGNKGRKLA